MWLVCKTCRAVQVADTARCRGPFHTNLWTPHGMKKCGSSDVIVLDQAACDAADRIGGMNAVIDIARAVWNAAGTYVGDLADQKDGQL